MELAHFDDLIAAARAQPLPQRLLMVFVSAELPADANEAERQAFAEGCGGTLTPLTCVDKAAGELVSFAALKDEAAQFLPGWDLVFAAAANEQANAPLPQAAIDAALQRMIAAIEGGNVRQFVAFDRSGQAVAIG